ncbi:hypothetical protein K2O51_31605 (plasmid) [Cupriavidus pinatubonensis]|uniref:hypothetical protein n=1 Tax=Cupriavidus pinatubonensis TaxID=248026 RepID=UPI001C734A06|nr:hypothetical protein [Cupriavidus pinatubonensis]QYY33576.1 hypothetical protein K2O51_31605 [Cupriavidus pinatubonensis]
MAIASLAGCAPAFKTTTNADMRVPENLRREVRVQKSIETAYANIATYAGECGPVGGVVLSPDKMKITITETAFGPQMRSVYMVVDIQSMGSNAIDFKGYSYYSSSMWQERIDTVLKAINDPRACA